MDIDIDDLIMGRVESQEETHMDLDVISVSEPKPKPVEVKVTLEELHSKVLHHEAHTRDILVDLRDVKFFASDQDMYITCPSDVYPKPLFFKADPEDSRNPKVTHAQKQFCKMLGVPHGFFLSNRPALRMNIVSTWQSGLDVDEGKGKCIVRVREGTDNGIIRAFLPRNTVPLPTSNLLEIIQKATEGKVDVLFARGYDQDDLIFHGRFAYQEEYECLGKKVKMGWSLLASDLGVCPLTVEALLVVSDTNAAFLASYGGESFFKTKYEGIQHNEIQKLIPEMLTNLKSQSAQYVERVVASAKTNGSYMPKVECSKFNRGKGLPSKFKRALFHEVHDKEANINNPWDLAQVIASVAESFDSVKRLSIEKAAGSYLNLMFGKDAEHA